MMNTVIALFSPKKQPRAPPPEDDDHMPHAKTKTYGRRDRKRARRALMRLSDGSQPRRRSDASSTGHGGTDDVRPAEESEVDLYDATPEPSRHTPGLERSTSPPKQPADNTTEDVSGKEGDQQEEDPDMEEEQSPFTRFLHHRWVGNAIEIQVEWEDGRPTWEPERNLHRDAPQTLFKYWKDQGGRPLNPDDPDMFDIFAIRKHSRDRRKLLVEWVGFEQKDMTWLPRRVVEQTAKEVVDEYWKGVDRKKRRR